MISFLGVHAGLVGLVFFVIFFCGVLLWTFRPGAKQEYNQNAYIPLKENEE